MDDNLSGGKFIAKKNLLGQILIEKGLITGPQLEQALEVQKVKGGLLGDILTQLGFVSQEALSMSLASQTETVYIPIEKYKISKDVLKLVPKEVAIKYQCIPLEKINSILAVAMVNPLDKQATSEIEDITGFKLIAMIATKVQIEKAIQANY